MRLTCFFNRLPPTQIIYTASGIPIKNGTDYLYDERRDERPWGHHHHQDHQRYQQLPVTTSTSLSARVKSRFTSGTNKGRANKLRVTEVSALNPRHPQGSMIGIQGVYNTLGSTHNSFVFTPPVEGERPSGKAPSVEAGGQPNPADDFYLYDRERQLVLKPSQADLNGSESSSRRSPGKVRKISHDGYHYYGPARNLTDKGETLYAGTSHHRGGDPSTTNSSSSEANWILLPAATWSQSTSVHPSSYFSSDGSRTVRGVGVQTSPLLPQRLQKDEPVQQQQSVLGSTFRGDGANGDNAGISIVGREEKSADRRPWTTAGTVSDGGGGGGRDVQQGSTLFSRYTPSTIRLNHPSNTARFFDQE